MPTYFTGSTITTTNSQRKVIKKIPESKEKILEQENRLRPYSHKLNTIFIKLTSDKYILDIITNGLKLHFKEISRN